MAPQIFTHYPTWDFGYRYLLWLNIFAVLFLPLDPKVLIDIILYMYNFIIVIMLVETYMHIYRSRLYS